MTCRYDGKLVVTTRGVEPCCADMHRLVIGGVVYLGKVSAKGSPTVCVPKIRLTDRVGITIGRCPICGAVGELYDTDGVCIHPGVPSGVHS